MNRVISILRKQLGFGFYLSILLLSVILSLSFRVKAGVTEYLSPQSTFILISGKPDALDIKSASLLNKWLNKVYKTDSGFQIVRENLIKDIKGKILIVVGKTKFAISKELDPHKPYSFIIERKNEIINIEGETPFGTLFGTTYFLDHYCGVRFYLPGDLFTSIPRSNKIKLYKNFSVYQEPFTEQLFSTGFKNSDESNWAQDNGLLRKQFGTHQHSMGERFYDDSVFKLFPEIFPLKNGKRYLPKSVQDQNWEPDFAEPKLVDASIYSAIKYFKKNPQINYISFSVQDSRIYPTEGKMGEFLRKYPNDEEGKKRAYTDAFVSFLNKLAERMVIELPKNGIYTPKTIIYLVYGYVRDVPLVKLNSSILPVTVFAIANSVMDSLNSKDGLLHQWSEVTNRYGNHDWVEGKGFLYPRIYTNLVSRFLKTIQKDKIEFEFAHLEMYPNWALDGPKYYLMSKIYWNPKVNTDSLLSLFCLDMFGKAEKRMKAYFNKIESLNTSMNNDRQRVRGLFAYTTQLSLNENEENMIKEAREEINKAYYLAATDVQKKRIDFFSKGFKISEGFFDLYNSKYVDTTKANELKEFLKNEVSGNQMMLNAATDNNFLLQMDALIDQIVKIKKGKKD